MIEIKICEKMFLFIYFLFLKSIKENRILLPDSTCLTPYPTRLLSHPTTNNTLLLFHSPHLYLG